jgi:PDZ domain-containing secreted protein
MNIFTSEVEMIRADNEDLQKTLAKLLWDYTELERAFNGVTGAKWLRKSDHPQRTWIGLTDEEVNTIYEQAEVLVHDSWVGNGTVGLMFPITLYKMFEAKLKEKT